jgi:hypothetical protein
MGRCTTPPGEQPQGKRGPKPKKGARQLSLKERLLDPQTAWHSLEVDWYGNQRRTLDIATGTNLWYTPGFDPLPIRWVLVRDPAGKFDPPPFCVPTLKPTPAKSSLGLLLVGGWKSLFRKLAFISA